MEVDLGRASSDTKEGGLLVRIGWGRSVRRAVAIFMRTHDEVLFARV